MNIEEKIIELIIALTTAGGTAATEYELYKDILPLHAAWLQGRASGLMEAVDKLNSWLTEIEAPKPAQSEGERDA